MSRPYSRKCDSCGKVFKSSSNGRVYCYDCSPANVAGRGRKNGAPAGQLSDDDRSALREETDADRIIRECVEVADDLESKARANPKQFRVGENDGGDRVFLSGRPKDGWGRCQFIDTARMAEECKEERFSERAPFCFYHLQHWREIRAKRMAVKADKAKTEEDVVKRWSYNPKTADDVVKFLGQVSRAVAAGQITTNKAESMVKVANAQLAALAHKREDAKAHAYIKKILDLKTMQDAKDFGEKPADFGDLDRIEKEYGIEEEEKKDDDSPPDSSGRQQKAATPDPAP